MKKITYKKSGVDIDKANVLLDKIKPLIRRTRTKGVLADIGSFSGLFDAAIFKEYKRPILVSSTDGVGTKLKIAFLNNIHDTVGIDLVAMNVNDVLTSGARPLFFLDYLACGKLEKEKYVDIIKGITDGCRQADCALIAGETAEMPGMYNEGEYDLAGFCVGIVDRDKIIEGKDVKVGDRVIGIASSGLHSNGFSLVRKVFKVAEQKKLAKELLCPTRIYVKPVLNLLRVNSYELPVTIKGIAHITGGAFYEKIPRIIPQGMAMVIKKDSWRVPNIFRLVESRSGISGREMYRTFNMGIGMVLVVKRGSEEKISKLLIKSGLHSWVIGEIIKGNREVILV